MKNAQNKRAQRVTLSPGITGGEERIRTPDTPKGIPVFETGPFNRSGTSPRRSTSAGTTPYVFGKIARPRPEIRHGRLPSTLSPETGVVKRVQFATRKTASQTGYSAAEPAVCGAGGDFGVSAARLRK
jgi:hypothetical protein